MKGIYWLASYPKSGNTWFRAFLANLQQERETPVNINELDDVYIASNRDLFDEKTGLAAADLTFEEIDRLRPYVYERMASVIDEPVFMKIHDAYTYTKTGVPLVSTSATLGAIYLIRNPLDVAVSFAHHSACDVQQIIDKMGDTRYTLCGKTHKQPAQLRQILRSWSSHVLSWVDAPDVPVHVVRYEDLLVRSIETFSGAVRFLGLCYNDSQIEKAIAQCSFSELQRQEAEQGFREKSPRSQSFFRQGKMEKWREVLTTIQVEQILTAHGEVMQRFGYYDDK